MFRLSRTARSLPLSSRIRIFESRSRLNKTFILNVSFPRKTHLCTLNNRQKPSKIGRAELNNSSHPSNVSKAYEQSGILAQVPRLVPPSQVSSVDVAQTPHYSGGTAPDLNRLPCYDFSATRNRLLIIKFTN